MQGHKTPSSFISLFIQQSYKDAWDSYALSLSGDISIWDYVILTASNGDQATAYERQIQYRIDRHMLSDSTHYIVLPDRGNQRIGSGGATLGAIRYVFEREGDFRGKRVLVIHSGGDSKRVPQYSACGKIFSPVPRILPDGRCSTLFDEFIIGMSGMAARLAEGMLVCSGDVVLLMNPLQVDFYGKGAAALSIKTDIETGKDHGVYLSGDSGNVGRFLHKQSEATLQTLGAVDELGNVDIDTGAVILDSNIMQSLYTLIDTDEKFDALVNARARLSFYADFLYPLAADSTLDAFYLEKPEGEFTEELRAGREKLWNALHEYSMKLIRLSPASFIHFGTSAELLKLMVEDVDVYSYLGWSRRVNCNRGGCFAANNSYISPRATVRKSAYIEDSYIHHGSVVGEGCIISGVTLDGQTIPDRAVLHGLKLTDGRFVARMYGVDDNPKECSLFGARLAMPLWEAPIYPVRDTIGEAVDATLQAYALGFPTSDISLKDGFVRADTSAILEWQDRLDDKVKVETLLEAIDNRACIDEAISVFRGVITWRSEQLLLSEIEKLDDSDLTQFGRKIRIYQALSKLPLRDRDKYASACFNTICSAVFRDAAAGLDYNSEARIVEEEVVERLPVRVNWGGGWSDTPPYCMEHGGTVLNAAITLDRRLPVEVCAHRIEPGKIVLASGDNGSYQEFTDIAQLQDCGNPYDPFALHKAALIACRLIPYKEKLDVETITRRLGGGIYLSTQVIGIPRGSGLGTSSVLGGACVKAIMRFIGKTPSANDLFNIVLCMEQLMSTGGGWQDQVGGLVPGVKMVSSEPGIHQKLNCTSVCVPEHALKDLSDRFCLVYTGQRRLARNLLRDVVSRYISSTPEALEAIYGMQRLAVLMRFELEKGNIDGFAELLNEHWELSKRLDSGSTNTCIDQIFNVIEDLIDGKMICGAGGGGFLQVILKKDVTFDMLNERLFHVFQYSGARAWKCAFA